MRVGVSDTVVQREAMELNGQDDAVPEPAIHCIRDRQSTIVRAVACSV